MALHWLEQTEADVPTGNDWLGPGEVCHLAAMRFPKRRTDWRLGRWTAKRAVAASLGGSPALSTIEIRAAPSGAPEVFFAGRPAALTISISHRGGVACCALAPGLVELGCDLELIEPRSAAFAADYFTDEEQALIAQTSAPDRPRLLTLLWSAKESALKALRVGLRCDTRLVVVHDVALIGSASAVEWRPLQVRHQNNDFHGWWRCEGTLVRTVVAAPRFDVPETFSRMCCKSGEWVC